MVHILKACSPACGGVAITRWACKRKLGHWGCLTFDPLVHLSCQEVTVDLCYGLPTRKSYLVLRLLRSLDNIHISLERLPHPRYIATEPPLTNSVCVCWDVNIFTLISKAGKHISLHTLLPHCSYTSVKLKTLNSVLERTHMKNISLNAKGIREQR